MHKTSNYTPHDAFAVNITNEKMDSIADPTKKRSSHAEIENILLFANKIDRFPYQLRLPFPENANAFWNYLNDDGRSEKERRNYIMFVRNDLERIIVTSILSQSDKDLLIAALNTSDQKNDARMVATLLGVVLFISVLPIIAMTAQSSAALTLVGCALSCAMLCMAPYALVEKCTSAKPYFSERHTQYDKPAFSNWCKKLSAAVDQVVSSSNMQIDAKQSSNRTNSIKPQ